MEDLKTLKTSAASVFQLDFNKGLSQQSSVVQALKSSLRYMPNISIFAWCSISNNLLVLICIYLSNYKLWTY